MSDVHIDDDVRAALCFALWHHQGGSSTIGQPIRKMLGIGEHDHMTEEQYAAAKGVQKALSGSPDEPVAIHQFRSPHCADWYDGIPDHHDGHGPYEVRTLYTSPPQTKRVVDCARRLVEHADFKLGGCLSADSKAKDIPSNAVSTVKARHLASLRDALGEEQ